MTVTPIRPPRTTHYACPALPAPLIDVLEQITRDLQYTDARVACSIALHPTGSLIHIRRVQGQFYAALYEKAYILTAAVWRQAPQQVALVGETSLQRLRDVERHEAGDVRCCDLQGCGCHGRRPSGDACDRCTSDVIQRHHDALQDYLSLIAEHLSTADADQLVALGRAVLVEQAS